MTYNVFGGTLHLALSVYGISGHCNFLLQMILIEDIDAAILLELLGVF